MSKTFQRIQFNDPVKEEAIDTKPIWDYALEPRLLKASVHLNATERLELAVRFESWTRQLRHSAKFMKKAQRPKKLKLTNGALHQN